MQRYSEATSKNKREVVLLKGSKCKWGKCVFCDYILDNTEDMNEANNINFEVLNNVKGTFKALEVINSGSVFELPKETLIRIKEVVNDKKIEILYFESHWIYKNRLEEIKEFFGIPIIFKLGMESFDEEFRNNVLKKGIVYKDINEVSSKFDSICLLVGIKGQNKEMIENDINILINNFKYGCINVYTNNSTSIVEDKELAKWIREKYNNMDEYPNIDILYHNTDFNVGDINE